MPHVGSAQDATEGHHCNEVARKGWCVSTTSCHQPKLRNHSNCAEKETTHPENVEDPMSHDVAMEQACEDQTSSHKGHYGKRVLMLFVCLVLNVQHAVEEAKHQGQGQHADALEQVVACLITGT